MPARKPVSFRLPPDVDDWVAVRGGNAFCRELVLREYRRELAKAKKVREEEKRGGAHSPDV